MTISSSFIIISALGSARASLVPMHECQILVPSMKERVSERTVRISRTAVQEEHDRILAILPFDGHPLVDAPDAYESLFAHRLGSGGWGRRCRCCYRDQQRGTRCQELTRSTFHGFSPGVVSRVATHGSAEGLKASYGVRRTTGNVPGGDPSQSSRLRMTPAPVCGSGAAALHDPSASRR